MRGPRAQYRLVAGIAQLIAATESVYDRQLVIFSADHQEGLRDALARARAELAVRGDVYGHDALAWVLTAWAGSMRPPSTRRRPWRWGHRIQDRVPRRPHRSSAGR